MTTVTHRRYQPLLVFDPAAAEIILAPEERSRGYWVGCPGLLYEADRGRFLLTYRQRRPRGGANERGWRCAVASSHDGLHFEDIWAVEKDELNTSSMERFSIQSRPDGGYQLFLSYVDPVDNRWRIDVIEAERPELFDINERAAVLTAESTGTEGVKDPYTFRVGPVTYLLASYADAAGLKDTDRGRAHDTADVYNTGVTTHPTGIAVSCDDHSFAWLGEALPVGTGWDRYQARLNSVARIGGSWLGFYDGSASADENYEERCGLAGSGDLLRWRTLSSAGPWIASPHGSHSLRYLDAVPVKDQLWLYYEYCRADGSHDLRLSRLHL